MLDYKSSSLSDDEIADAIEYALARDDGRLINCLVDGIERRGQRIVV